MPKKGRKGRIRTLDLFCGIGGSSLGANEAGATIVAGVDKWGLAIEVFSKNFPQAEPIRSKLQSVNPKELKEKIGAINLLLASPECTNHTPARGRRSIDEDSRKTAYQVIRFARVFKPRWIVVENVIQMKQWKRYSTFLNRLRNLGYKIRDATLNAADFGVAQSRCRLFILCDRRHFPRPVQPTVRKWRTANTIVSLDGKYPATNTWKRRLADRTRNRIRIASKRLGRRVPFLVVYYGTDKGGDSTGGWQTLDAPLRTVTTLDRFALVKPRRKTGKTIRMLQVPELKRAMGFPEKFKLNYSTRRDRIHLLGNAVCPPVMKAVIKALTSS